MTDSDKNVVTTKLSNGVQQIRMRNKVLGAISDYLLSSDGTAADGMSTWLGLCDQMGVLHEELVDLGLTSDAVAMLGVVLALGRPEDVTTDRVEQLELQKNEYVSRTGVAHG